MCTMISNLDLGRGTWPEMPGELIREVDLLALHTWPAATVVDIDGWKLRYNDGVTRRANSVWPNEGAGSLPLDQKIAAVESFYGDRGLVSRLQLSPASRPTDLDRELDRRGYTTHAHTSTQIADTHEVLLATARPCAPAVTVSVAPNDAWLAVYRDATDMRDHEADKRRGILERIGPATLYALLSVSGQPVATGVGVCERGWMGVICMATLEHYRRRGAATAILHVLAASAAERGAQKMYLQVMQENQPACRAYERAGFRPLYDYWYREIDRSATVDSCD